MLLGLDTFCVFVRGVHSSLLDLCLLYGVIRYTGCIVSDPSTDVEHRSIVKTPLRIFVLNTPVVLRIGDHAVRHPARTHFQPMRPHPV